MKIQPRAKPAPLLRDNRVRGKFDWASGKFNFRSGTLARWRGRAEVAGLTGRAGPGGGGGAGVAGLGGGGGAGRAGRSWRGWAEVVGLGRGGGAGWAEGSRQRWWGRAGGRAGRRWRGVAADAMREDRGQPRRVPHLLGNWPLSGVLWGVRDF